MEIPNIQVGNNTELQSAIQSQINTFAPSEEYFCYIIDDLSDTAFEETLNAFEKDMDAFFKQRKLAEGNK